MKVEGVLNDFYKFLIMNLCIHVYLFHSTLEPYISEAKQYDDLQNMTLFGM